MMGKEIMVEGLYLAKSTKTDIGFDAKVWNNRYKMGTMH